MFSSLQALGISSLNEMQETSLKAHRETDHIILLSPTGCWNWKLGQLICGKLGIR